MDASHLSNFVKNNRSRLGLRQEQLAEKAGVGLRFIRDLEQGKATLRMDKVNQVLALFGFSVIPGKELDPYDILEKHINKNVRIFLKNKSVLYGFIIGEVRAGLEITGWKFVSNPGAIEYQKTEKEELIQIIPHRDIERIETFNLMARSEKVFYKNRFAGRIWQDENGYAYGPLLITAASDRNDGNKRHWISSEPNR